ncbi:MAG: right-handed parallel beta-helix repeat-containing protein [bacterium]|nr:right-handed parallel beta-helix repeat-containing protein [bacterium]
MTSPGNETARAACLALALAFGCSGATPESVWEVHPGEDIQAALEQAADAKGREGRRVVRVFPGTYAPARPGQASIWFHARHDGIELEAHGRVVLTAANAELSDPQAESHPAVVNHVVYFGDGVSSATALRGFEITGANHFLTRSEDPGPVQPYVPITELTKSKFFYEDGGAIKVFGRSYPTLERLVIQDNYASPCAGGISIEHRGFKLGEVTLRDCILRANRARITGAAIDVLPGSYAVIENCLFVGNVSNLGEDFITPHKDDSYPRHGSGALTVFALSTVRVERCTFTGNWNGVDDRGSANAYVDSIFWHNTLGGGTSPGPRYELDIVDASGVRGCFLGGELLDVRSAIDPAANRLAAPEPDFDKNYRPRSPAYSAVGYRPVEPPPTR